MSKQTKEEQKAYRKQYRLDNKEKIKERNKQYRLDNKEKQRCRKEYSHQWYLDNKEKKRQYYLDNKEKKCKQARKRYLDNKEKMSDVEMESYKLKNKEYHKQYYLDNKEKVDSRNKQWWLDNKQKRRESIWRYKSTRYKSDPLFKLKATLRDRTRSAFKKKSWIRNSPNEKLLGCDWKTAFHHIEKQFEPWMNWENHGEWHIDHIKPLASANTIEEMTPLFHYTNLQPLSAGDNLRKGDKILN
jgi:hypothetical protein